MDDGMGEEGLGDGFGLEGDGDTGLDAGVKGIQGAGGLGADGEGAAETNGYDGLGAIGDEGL